MKSFRADATRTDRDGTSLSVALLTRGERITRNPRTDSFRLLSRLVTLRRELLDLLIADAERDEQLFQQVGLTGWETTTEATTKPPAPSAPKKPYVPFALWLKQQKEREAADAKLRGEIARLAPWRKRETQ
jgi:hypothetical protein